jgi:ribosomal protein L40E
MTAQYSTTCRQCGVSFPVFFRVKPGSVRCRTCRHTGLRGLLLAPLFLVARLVGFCWRSFFTRPSP